MKERIYQDLRRRGANVATAEKWSGVLVGLFSGFMEFPGPAPGAMRRLLDELPEGEVRLTRDGWRYVTRLLEKNACVALSSDDAASQIDL